MKMRVSRRAGIFLIKICLNVVILKMAIIGIVALHGILNGGADVAFL